MHRRLWFRLLIAAPAVVGVTYSILCACAPAMTLPAPAPMGADRPNEIGLYAAGLVAQPLQRTDLPGGGGSGGLYFYRRVGAAGGLGFTAFGGNTSLVGGGLVARLNLTQSDNVVVSLQPEAGWLWGALSIPVAVRVAPRTWLHAAPGGGYRIARFAELPLGLTWAGRDGFTVTGELAVSYGDGAGSGDLISINMPIGPAIAGRAGLLLAYRFGGRKARGMVDDEGPAPL